MPNTQWLCRQRQRTHYCRLASTMGHIGKVSRRVLRRKQLIGFQVRLKRRRERHIDSAGIQGCDNGTWVRTPLLNLCCFQQHSQHGLGGTVCGSSTEVIIGNVTDAGR
jgi:hypothetical protein